MDIKEYSIDDLQKDGEVRRALFDSMQNGRLVPVIGSGFTSGLPARNGFVPTADELKEFAISQYGELLDLSAGDLEEERKQPFSLSTTRFMNALKWVEGDKAGDAIARCQEFFDDNFTCVNGLSIAQIEFLKSGWPYLYTLNYDDAIERVLRDYTLVLPKRRIDRDFLKENRDCLIKLHGDANDFVESGDIDRIILGKERYVDSLFSDSNRLLIDWMRTDFSSKDLLLVGCGLEDEIDLLFARTTSVDGDIARTRGNCSFYVMYDKSPDQPLSYQTKSKLWDYGLENVIRLTPDEYGDFYSAIAEIWNEVEEVRKYKPIESFVGTTVAIRSPNREEDLRYLYSGKGLMSRVGSTRTVLLPSFFVRRSAARRLFEMLSADKSICIVFGRRFSGKTYLLLDILQRYQLAGTKAYYFANEAVTDQMLAEIDQLSDCALIFDSETVDGEQVNNHFLRNLARLRRKKVKVVCAMGKSDFQMIEALLQDDLIKDDMCCLWELSPHLTGPELRDFNENAKQLVLLDRRPKETFLDYAIRIESESLSEGPYVRLLEDIKTEMGRNRNMLICLIALSVRPWFDSAAASTLHVENEVRWLCDSSRGVVQDVHISFNKRRWWNHSGAVYVVNSYYYIHRVLQQFAFDKNNYELIAQAMKTIVQRYRYASWGTQEDFRKKVRPFIYFDTLQEVFGMRAGSLRLCESVYVTLAQLFVDDFQFLHQYAKCELRVARSLDSLLDRTDKLEVARSYIDKASELAEKYGGVHKNITLAHMSFTKALILMNYLHSQERDGGFYDPDRVDSAIEEFYEAYAKDKDYVGLLTDSREKKDIDWFVKGLKDRGGLRELVDDADHLRMAEAIISKYYALRVRLTED